MSNLRIAFAILPLVFATACLETTSTVNEDYCGQHDGDAYCQGLDPSVPYCVLSTDACLSASDLDASTRYACVAEIPADECRQTCGIGNGDACDPTDPTVTDTSTGGETESSSTTLEPETDTEEPSTTTGPECSEEEPCLDAGAPFCVEGMCSTCDATEAPDESCAMVDEGLPLCVGTSCVQCTAESPEACGGETPLCDGEVNTCVGCSFHEECLELGGRACNIATGACFSGDAASVSEVSLSSANALQNAINGVADGAEHVIVVTGSMATNHSATVDGGKSIAIVSTDASVQDISGNASPVVTVTGAGSTVFLHRVRLDGSSDVGISVASGGTLYADSTQVAGNDGGGIELAAGTSGFLRNCMVAGFAGNASAISSSGALSVLYSTLGRDTNFGDPVLECSGGSTMVRNSIIVSQTNAPGTEVDCPGISIENSAERASQTPADWFGAGFASGNYSLTVAGQTEFADVAIWELGDPPFDFEGDDRPNTDGADDFAGADTVP